jgi:hypothetical protein
MGFTHSRLPFIPPALFPLLFFFLNTSQERLLFFPVSPSIKPSLPLSYGKFLLFTAGQYLPT